MTKQLTLLQPPPSKESEQAAHRFVLRVAQVGEINARFDNDLTIPLFPLALILDADGTLAKDARGVLQQSKGNE